MFLTTNRVLTYDAAFKSRIHLTINYPSLDYQSRKLVWVTFAGPASGSSSIYGSDLTEGDLDELANLKINNREIKNTVDG